MPYDALLMFSDRQAVTTTAVSTDTLDMNQPSINPLTKAPLPVSHGASMDVPVVVKVSQGFAGLTSLTAQLQQSDSPDSGFETIASTRVIPLADLTAGAEFGFISLPLEARKRYLRMNYVVVGTGTAGTITAGVGTGFQTAGRV